MSIESFFSRPGLVCEISDRIKNDLKFAKNRILGAAFSLTDEEYIRLIINSPVPIKKFIINNDENYKIKERIKDIIYIKLGKMTCNNQFKIQMHHKFLIIDNILWVGSYNLSKNATLNNWENIMRITNFSIINEYVNEFKKMYIWGKAFENSNIIGYKLFDKNMKECSLCKKESICHNHKYIYCKDCGKKIEDPFEHFRVRVKVTQDAEAYFNEVDGEYYQSNFIKKNKSTIDKIDLECIHSDKSTEKFKCPICGNPNWEKSLSKIDVYNNVGIYYQSRDEIVWDKDKDSPLGTRPKYSSKGQQERNDSSEKMCLQCLYDIVEERWNK